jgi:hypothetical protein
MENASFSPSHTSSQRGAENNGEMTLEEYLYRKNPYRSTTTPNPPPWPVDIRELPKIEEQKSQPYHQQIEQILYDNGFFSIHGRAGEYLYLSKGSFKAVRMSGLDYPGGETAVTVFLIKFFEDGLPEQMGLARDQIRDLF